MTNTIQSPINGAQAPAAARARMQAGTALAGNFSEGVIDSFPMISFRGKVFRFRFQGEEKPHLDPQSGHPIPYLDVVLLNASPNISKAFYDTGFTEGANTPPTCWSIDGIRPDASVVAKQNPTCPDCRQNAFGSRVTPAGKQAKACQDRRRLVVGLAAGFGTREVLPIMLNAPQSSLKPMREYVMFLQRNGFPPNACVTRLSFDFNEAYPKLTFNFVQPLTDQQYAIAEQMENDDRTKRILQAAITGTAADDMDGEPGTLRTAATPPNNGYVQPAPQAPPPGPVAQAATAPPPPYQQPPAQPSPFDTAPVTGTGYSPVPQAPPPAAPVQAAPVSQPMPWETAAAQPMAPPPPPPPQPQPQPQPIQAAAPPPPPPPPQPYAAPPNPAMGNTLTDILSEGFSGAWAPSQPVSAVPGPGWATPQAAFVPPTDGDVPEFLRKAQASQQTVPAQPEAAAVEEKPAPKRRVKASPAQTAEVTAEAQAAPANMEKSLADLLGGL